MRINILLFFAVFMMISKSVFALTVITGSGQLAGIFSSKDELIDNGDGTYTLDDGQAIYTGILQDGGDLLCQKEVWPDQTTEYFYDESGQHTGWITTNTDGTKTTCTEEGDVCTVVIPDTATDDFKIDVYYKRNPITITFDTTTSFPLFNTTLQSIQLVVFMFLS